MTTRITLSILLTTWIVLIIGEAAAFLTAGESLLYLLDDSINRASHLAETTNLPAGQTQLNGLLPRGDHYEIKIAPTKPPRIGKDFVTGESGARERRVTLRTRVLSDGRLVQGFITYWKPTKDFDRLLSHIASMLLLISLVCGLTTAWLALKLSRAALRPLRDTADLIAEIDERKLGRRIDVDALPIELVPMSRRLNEMLERLQNVFQQRKQFLADAAHELRTPTASLLTTMEVALRRPRDQAALTEAMNTSLADARRLRKLVEQLMEHARSEHAKGPEAMQQSDVPAILRECVDIVTPLAREKDVAITPDVPGELAFITQRDRLRSVVLNLLTNAIEYNHASGSVSIACRRDSGALELSVKDTGQGIAPDQLPHVFEPFYRGGNGRGDDPTHLGLGLFLVRSHVQALGGTSEIESRLGEGTTVRIRLPEGTNGVASSPASVVTAQN